MKVIDFRMLTTEDESNIEKYNDGFAWSRIYEYHLAEEFLENNVKTGSKIHNSAWGFQGVHVIFRNSLDSKYDCVHSDIHPESKRMKTYHYNLLNVDSNLENYFDCVLNISVLEHLPNGFLGTKEALSNLMKQVRVGGYLFCTFDYPEVDLDSLESWLGVKCDKSGDRLNGLNSKLKNERWSDLNVVLLVMEKVNE